MWWRSPIFALAALAAMAGLGLAGCGFQPLYGSNTTTASGARLSEAMASVDVQPIPGRVGQKVRNELIFSNTGGGYAPQPKYKLRIAIRERVIDQLVQISGDARGQVYQLEATFKLVDASNGTIIHQGSAVSRAPYSRYQEIFANVRARYDAENRAAETVSESIKTQVAAFLASAA
jgi:LPS-assembly lipoprotein